MNIARSLSLFAIPLLLIACGEAAEGTPDTAQPDAPATEAPAPAEKAMDPARDAAEAPAEAGATTSITFAENSHDFGTIDVGSKSTVVDMVHSDCESRSVSLLSGFVVHIISAERPVSKAL